MSVTLGPTALSPEREFEINLDATLALVKAEVLRAKAKFPRKSASGHEAYAVLLEEVDELWETVKKNMTIEFKQMEAVQVAAMAVRFLLEVEK